MTAMYWQENRQILSDSLGRKVSREEAYMAHLLGPAGALKVIKASGNRAAWKVAGIDPSKNKKFFMKGRNVPGTKPVRLPSSRPTSLPRCPAMRTRTGNMPR
jgi:hypothetical protein